ncbi:putative ribonuclease H protein [Glycine max]|nr:putative ribonuclease H protein [Glycine max]
MLLTATVITNEGGLGIKEISKFNVALLGKWIWALASGQQYLWARIINSKYGGWTEFQFGREKRGFSYWWRDLRKLYHQKCGYPRNVAMSSLGGSSRTDSLLRKCGYPRGCLSSLWSNDTVFVGEALWDNVIVMKAMLRGFEMVSGLKINFSKSSVGIFGVDINWYLGIPIGAKPSSCLVWEPLIKKFEAKLSKWNQKLLSMAGKVTLINSVLTALPIYLLSFFKIPLKVAQKVNSLQRNFLWGGSQDLKKIAWVKWEGICLPKELGGLGIKDITSFNAALLGRWLWALSSNQNQLWVRILTSKYGGWADLNNGRDRPSHSQWWRDLQKLIKQPEFSPIHHHLVWKVGDGSIIKFWKDKWLGADSNLEQQYNQLFLISGQQNNTISNMGNICSLIFL